MRPALLLTPFVPWLAVLVSCSAPPKPPKVDESRKRPVNTAMAVELQVCKSDLQNTRLRAIESERLAETLAVTQQNMAALQQAVTALQPRPWLEPRPGPEPRPDSRPEPRPDSRPNSRPQPNSIVTVRFDYGSTRVDIPADTARDLVSEAKTAPLILLRGRTDGQGDAPAESRIARARAAAVSDYLVAAGVSPSRIRATYQPTGDHVADNESAHGRALNRRVEIELYRAAPEALNAHSAADATAH